MCVWDTYILSTINSYWCLSVVLVGLGRWVDVYVYVCMYVRLFPIAITLHTLRVALSYTLRVPLYILYSRVIAHAHIHTYTDVTPSKRTRHANERAKSARFLTYVI